MPKPNIMGSVLMAIRQLRNDKKREVEDDLWKRNNIEHERHGYAYKVEEVTTVDKTGKELTTMKLWHLVDVSELLIETNVTSSVKIGVPDYGKPQPKRALEKRDTTSPL